MKNKKSFLAGILAHIIIILSTHILGYDSYKELTNGFVPLTNAAKNSIKLTFPWNTLVFLSLYFIYLKKSGAGSIFLSLRQYAQLFIIYSAVTNLFYYIKGGGILFYFNLSTAYLILIFIYHSIFLTLSSAHESKEEIPSRNFFFAFMASMVISALFLLLNLKSTATALANIAYFLLVIGIGIEIYNTFSNETSNE